MNHNNENSSEQLYRGKDISNPRETLIAALNHITSSPTTDREGLVYLNLVAQLYLNESVQWFRFLYL